MFRQLEIHNFRAIQSLKVDGLGQINAFVGLNGSGKTSLLEALALNASSCGLTQVRQIFLDHGLGTALAGSDLIEYSLRDLLNHQTAQSNFTVALDQRSIGCEILPEGDPLAREFEANLRPLLAPDELRRIRPGIHRLYSPAGVTTGSIDRTREWLSFDPIVAGPILIQAPMPLQLPYTSLPCYVAMDRAIEELWNTAVNQGREDVVEEAVRTILPEVRRINYVQRSQGTRRHAVPMVRLEGHGAQPLQSLGQGAVRAFQLAVAAVAAANGLLLIDELESGLHHSIFNSLTGKLAESAKQQNSQIFLTTHSQDCVDALATLGNDYDVRIFRLHRYPAGDHCVYRFEPQSLACAVENGLEIR